MFRQTTFRLAVGLILFCGTTMAFSQDSEPPAAESVSDKAEETKETVKKETGELVDETKQHVGEIAKQVDSDPRAQEATAGILKPIYTLAEHLSFPWFHWIAFAVMVTGVVSYAFQLVLGKLVVLTKLSISISEILSDALGFVISAVGLVLTTQAAAENSTFTESPASVLSATIVGALAGLMFYIWGQRQEVQAAEARKLRTPAAP
jgi:hypothetical protein